MTFEAFLSALRVMRSLTRRELIAAEVMTAEDAGAWLDYQLDPSRFMVRMGPVRGARLFALIDSQQPPHLRLAFPDRAAADAQAAAEAVLRESIRAGMARGGDA